MGLVSDAAIVTGAGQGIGRGIAQFTEAVAGEAGRHGIRMNAVAPGSTHTPLAEENGVLGGRFGREWRERTPLEHRMGQPEDVGKVAAFLASDYAGWVTGETICVDGGQNIRGLHSYWDVYQEQFGGADQGSATDRDQGTAAGGEGETAAGGEKEAAAD